MILKNILNKRSNSAVFMNNSFAVRNLLLPTNLGMTPLSSGFFSYANFRIYKSRTKLLSKHQKKYFLVENSSNTSKNLPKNQPKKLICISPAGLKGFYQSGIVAYIKENYDVSNFIFSGASAGSWNAILFTYRGNLTEFIYNLIGEKQSMKKNESIRSFKFFMKDRILKNYKIDDFELDRVYIGVTTTRWSEKKSKKNNEETYEPKWLIKTSIYSNFSTLEDALDCCIASSHIPFFMGRVFHTYNNQIVFDGGFSHYPYYPLIEPTLNITHNMWKHDILSDSGHIDEQKNKNFILDDYTTLLSKDKYNFIELFHNGYKDTEKNRKFLDKILPRKQNKDFTK
jgi:hypothetical protein